jgi:drug/metabolite transporter (DMT)-like permease
MLMGLYSEKSSSGCETVVNFRICRKAVDAMNAFLNSIVWFFLLSPLILAIFLVPWSIKDAKLRGKSPLLVALAVVLFFPWGLLAWLVFRPEVIDTAGSKRSFRLEDYRVQ